MQSIFHLAHILQMMTISRGGCTMTIVKSANFGVPPIVIGTHLDQVIVIVIVIVPSIVIGTHLDQVQSNHDLGHSFFHHSQPFSTFSIQEGLDILDSMLAGTATIEETVITISEQIF